MRCLREAGSVGVLRRLRSVRRGRYPEFFERSKGRRETRFRAAAVLVVGDVAESRREERGLRFVVENVRRELRNRLFRRAALLRRIERYIVEDEPTVFARVVIDSVESAENLDRASSADVERNRAGTRRRFDELDLTSGAPPKRLPTRERVETRADLLDLNPNATAFSAVGAEFS